MIERISLVILKARLYQLKEQQDKACLENLNGGGVFSSRYLEKLKELIAQLEDDIQKIEK